LRFGPRWIIGTLLVAAIVGGCISAGFWQLRRLDQRRATNAQVRARSAEVIDLPAAGFSKGADEDDLIFRRVRVTGTYDVAHELLVRFRSRKGLPGYEVVTPLRNDEGIVLVNRGWVPLDVGDRWPDQTAAAPSGEVEVEGLLAPAESGPVRLARDVDDREAVPKIAAVDPIRLAGAVGAGAGERVYALPVLASEANGSYPAPVDPPDLGEGPHRDYAVQWFLFATVGIVGWPLLLFRRGPFARARKVAS
jgi:cytochrome oxidase assembly protein ShyY1